MSGSLVRLYYRRKGAPIGQWFYVEFYTVEAYVAFLRTLEAGFQEARVLCATHDVPLPSPATDAPPRHAIVIKLR